MVAIPTVTLYGDISPATVEHVRRRLFVARDLVSPPGGRRIILKIDSLGGKVDSAEAICALLLIEEARGLKVTALIEGACCSSATFVAFGCESVLIRPDGWVGLHRITDKSGAPCTKIDAEMVALYRRRSGLSESAILALVDRSARLSAPGALQPYGFVDAIVPDEDHAVEAIHTAFHAAEQRGGTEQQKPHSQ